MTAKPRAKASAPKTKSVRRKAKPAPSTKSRPAQKSARKAKKSAPPPEPSTAAAPPPAEAKANRPAVAQAPKPAEPKADPAPTVTEDKPESPKHRRRGLGKLSQHAFSPVSAPINLVLKARPQVKREIPSPGIPAALPSFAVSFLRTELAAILAIVDEPSS